MVDALSQDTRRTINIRALGIRLKTEHHSNVTFGKKGNIRGQRCLYLIDIQGI